MTAANYKIMMYIYVQPWKHKHVKHMLSFTKAWTPRLLLQLYTLSSRALSWRTFMALGNWGDVKAGHPCLKMPPFCQAIFSSVSPRSAMWS